MSGCLTGRRVRVTRMKSRHELVGKKGSALGRRRDGPNIRYRVLLDGDVQHSTGARTIDVLVGNLEAIDDTHHVKPFRQTSTLGLRNFGLDELVLVLTQVLIRNDRNDGSDLATAVIHNDRNEISADHTAVAKQEPLKLCLSNSACIPYEVPSRFAALSSVSVGWLEAAKAAASAQLAPRRDSSATRSLLSVGMEIVEAEPQNHPRLKGRALMIRRLHSAALPKPPKAKVEEISGRVVRTGGVHVMTGEPSSWHFREDGRSASQARALARMDEEAHPEPETKERA